MSKILNILKLIFSFIAGLFKKKDVVEEENMKDKGYHNWTKVKTDVNNVPPTVKEEPVVPTDEVKFKELLSPIRHKRYISMYCIADLADGAKDIKDAKGNVIHSISIHSYKRLIMEGTGRLSDGRVVNVGEVHSGVWSFKVMDSSSPDGLGIRGAALKPWVSLAHHLPQLKEHSLFKRTVVIPSLKGYVTPEGETLSGVFEVHDTGGGLRSCPYENGLWRTGSSRKYYGQFDLFVGKEVDYKHLLGTWDSYKEVIVMPRDLESVAGSQEALNLLMDAGLAVDGVEGPKTRAAIVKLQDKAGIEQTGGWTEDTRTFVELSLNNW